MKEAAEHRCRAGIEVDRSVSIISAVDEGMLPQVHSNCKRFWIRPERMERSRTRRLRHTAATQKEGTVAVQTDSKSKVVWDIAEHDYGLHVRLSGCTDSDLTTHGPGSGSLHTCMRVGFKSSDQHTHVRTIHGMHHCPH